LTEEPLAAKIIKPVVAKPIAQTVAIPIALTIFLCVMPQKSATCIKIYAYFLVLAIEFCPDLPFPYEKTVKI